MDTLPPNHTSYYQILNIPKSSTPQDIKAAYHKHLLTYHPDKQHQKDHQVLKPSIYSISEIQNAYKMLINKDLRVQYDQLLHVHFIKLGLVDDLCSSGIDLNGIDHIDLSEFTETDDFFKHSCPRCKFENGFVITDEDLENSINDHQHDDDDDDDDNDDDDNKNYQLLIQCASCSLWLCITFSIN